MTELHNRLGSPEMARELPGTLLMKVAMDYVKHLERRNELLAAKQDQEKIDPLDVIDLPGLDVERRVVILAEYLGDIEEAWQRASKRMEELLEEVSNGEVVQDVQEVVPAE